MFLIKNKYFIMLQIENLNGKCHSAIKIIIEKLFPLLFSTLIIIRNVS